MYVFAYGSFHFFVFDNIEAVNSFGDDEVNLKTDRDNRRKKKHKAAEVDEPNAFEAS